MKKILVAVSCILLAAAVASAADAKKASKPAAPKLVAWPAADIKWSDLPGTPGVQFCDLWGDHTKGAYGTLVKFPAGSEVPLHTHTNDMRTVVVSGTLIHTPEGKAGIRLGSGSYIKQPGHGYKHTTACDKASECIIFTESAGAFDVLPVEAKK